MPFQPAGMYDSVAPSVTIYIKYLPMVHNHYQLDARNLLCPMPVIRTQDRVLELNSGDRLSVKCTDPGAKNDIPAWCRINGHNVVSIEESDELIVITLEVGSD